MTTENEGQGNQPNGQQNQGDAGQNGNQGNQGDQNKGTSNNDSILDLEGKNDGVKFKPGEKPEGLDDALWDAENKTFKGDALYEKLTAAEKQAKDLREKMGRRGAPPEKADDYKFEAPADAPWKDMVPADDPVLKAAKDVAHKLGLSQGQFGPLVQEVLNAAYKNLEAQEGQEQAEPTEEEKAAFREAEIAKIGPNGPAVVKAVSEFVRQNIGVHFDEKSVNTIKAMTSTTEGIHLLNQIREMVGSGERIPMGNIDGQAVTGLPSDAEIMSFMGSAEYQKGDAAALQKVDKWMDMRQKAGRPLYLQA